MRAYLGFIFSFAVACSTSGDAAVSGDQQAAGPVAGKAASTSASPIESADGARPAAGGAAAVRGAAGAAAVQGASGARAAAGTGGAAADAPDPEAPAAGSGNAAGAPSAPLPSGATAGSPNAPAAGSGGADAPTLMGVGNCCMAHDTPGCGNADLQVCVCEQLPSCCTEKWDAACTFIVTQKHCQPGVRECVCGTASDQWGQAQCCDQRWSNTCDEVAESKCAAQPGCF